MNVSTLTEQLSLCEQMSFGLFASGLVALAVMFAKHELRYYHYWKTMGACMVQFTICLLVVSIGVWLALVALEAAYLTWLKHAQTVERFAASDEQLAGEEPGEGQSCCSRCCFARITFLVVLQLLGLGLMAFTVYVALSLDHVHAFLWSGMYFSTLALALGGWLCADDCYDAYQKRVLAAKIDYHALLCDGGGPGTLAAGGQGHGGQGLGGGGEIARMVSPSTTRVSRLRLTADAYRLPSPSCLSRAVIPSSVAEDSYGPEMKNPNFAAPKTTTVAPVAPSAPGGGGGSDPEAATAMGSGEVSQNSQQPQQPNVESYNKYMRTRTNSFLGLQRGARRQQGSSSPPRMVKV